MTSKREGFFYELDWFLRNCNIGKLILISLQHFSNTYNLHHENVKLYCIMYKRNVQKTVLYNSATDRRLSRLCDSADALYLRNSSVGHASALNLPCSIGNFKRRAFVPQMSNVAEIIAVLSNAYSNMQ
jgi:hypothetical protein